MFKSDKEIMMYFHTSLRNIGLMTSIALAMQAYSMRTTDNKRSISIHFGYLIFLALAIYINVLFIEDLKNSKDAFKSVLENRWINIPYLTITLLIIMLMLGSFNFLKNIFKLMK
uniref:DUF202 domain-containing protein n=1 Tax=viral metagenome TaxID=1070528 RepID=A0A6C0BV73_9ZZZZ